MLDTALQVAADCPSLERIVIFDMVGLRDFADARCEDFSRFCARGGDHDRANPGLWESGIAAHARDPLAMPTAHRDERLAFLPMSDPAERVYGCYRSLADDVISNYAESPDTVLENLQEVQPTLLCASAATWERLHARIELAVAEATRLQRLAYRLAIGHRGALAWCADQLVLRNVRRDIGLDRLRLATVAGKLPAPEIAAWYRALGIELRPIDDEDGDQVPPDNVSC